MIWISIGLSPFLDNLYKSEYNEYDVAQWIEHGSKKAKVVGSNPIIPARVSSDTLFGFL